MPRKTADHLYLFRIETDSGCRYPKLKLELHGYTLNAEALWRPNNVWELTVLNGNLRFARVGLNVLDVIVAP